MAKGAAPAPRGLKPALGLHFRLQTEMARGRWRAEGSHVYPGTGTHRSTGIRVSQNQGSRDFGLQTEIAKLDHSSAGVYCKALLPSLG